MRVLVTNDDGLHAPGLSHLAGAAARAGHQVLAVAPEQNRSGSAAAIDDLGEQSSIRCRAKTLAGLDGVEAYELDAPPALCVVAAMIQAFGDPPELVLSGINPGLNTGRSTLHSGTVGAVLTAANFGVSGVAVSIAGHEPTIRNWGVAADLAVQAVDWVRAQDGVSTLNLNVPDLPASQLSEPVLASLARKGAVHTEVLERDDEWIRLGFRETTDELPEGTDTRVTADGHPAVTPITGIRVGEITPEQGARLLVCLAASPRSDANGVGT
ncbi:MAG: 5'/3'-nucleotidase SurE [Actinomycetia bacterium]|nr:5'/3'-nucleotidase SurE [Actinomycetes bacterium]